MKILNSLLLAAAATVTLNLATQAAESTASPRSAQLRRELRTVPRMTTDINLATNRPVGNAKAWSLARDLRKGPVIGPEIDLAHAPRPTLSPKDPRFEIVRRENAVRQFKVAPLK